MTRARPMLIFLILGMTVLHVGYSIQSDRSVLQGAYFTSGIIVTSSGENYEMATRFQSHGKLLHDFEYVNLVGNKFSFTRQGSLLGSARYVTNPSENYMLKSSLVSDRDIAFNYAYLTGRYSDLTLYRLPVKGRTPCFYINELEKVICFGRERVRTAPPL